jgi:hypothetical protein
MGHPKPDAFERFVNITYNMKIQGFIIIKCVADAVALQGFASSPEHIATHAPL